MQSQEGKTTLVASQEAKTTLEKPRFDKHKLIVRESTIGAALPKDTEPVEEGMVRVRTIRPIALGETIYQENCVLDVTPDAANEFCDTKFAGQYTHSGEVGETNAKKHELYRAVRI